ncbi:hypothetical protein [Cucumibacter marinus]|uniref:hypothetical protein n=1 Tax=Cucumibacter marinus TaxID=1121252 RepID=UPI0003F5891B|nr:hypothetical protein [Cucumibacter marinus]
MNTANTTARPDRASYLEPSPYEVDGGALIGRHPDQVVLADLKAIGPTSPIKAIRAKCIDCSGGNASEARKCTATGCALWPFRMGKNPFWGKGASEPSAEIKPANSEGFSHG